MVRYYEKSLWDLPYARPDHREEQVEALMFLVEGLKEVALAVAHSCAFTGVGAKLQMRKQRLPLAGMEQPVGRGRHLCASLRRSWIINVLTRGEITWHVRQACVQRKCAVNSHGSQRNLFQVG